GLPREEEGEARQQHRQRVAEAAGKPLDDPLHHAEGAVADHRRMGRNAYHWSGYARMNPSKRSTTRCISSAVASRLPRAAGAPTASGDSTWMWWPAPQRRVYAGRSGTPRRRAMAAGPEGTT